MPRWCWCDLVHKSGFALRNMCNPLSYALLGCPAPYFCPICPNWDANFNKTCLKLQKWRTSKQEGQCSEFRTSDLFCGPNQIVRGLQSNIIRIIMKCIVVPISTWNVDVFLAFFPFPGPVAFFCASVIPLLLKIPGCRPCVMWGDASMHVARDSNQMDKSRYVNNFQLQFSLILESKLNTQISIV